MEVEVNGELVALTQLDEVVVNSGLLRFYFEVPSIWCAPFS